MRPIAVVGCGFLGSIVVTEWLRRSFAGELPLPLLCIDHDHWERRNAANQNVSLADATWGEQKAKTMAKLAMQFERLGIARTVRLTQKNFAVELRTAEPDVQHGVPPVVIVDAVDNLATRQLLYNVGIQLSVPVLHVGLSPSGVGLVEWSYPPQHDTFHLSPLRMVGKPPLADPVTSTLPPCELVQMRSAGLNIGLAAALALGIYFGFDPEEYVSKDASRGWMTEWTASPFGYAPQKETWTLTEENVP